MRRECVGYRNSVFNKPTFHSILLSTISRVVKRDRILGLNPMILASHCTDYNIIAHNGVRSHYKASQIDANVMDNRRRCH